MPESGLNLASEMPSKLHYTSDETPGYGRIQRGNKTSYVDENGRQIENERILNRIAQLVIPPAWTDVWICPNQNGHLQVTGRDARQRKQAIYHPDWSEFRAGQKFLHLADFGDALPRIRRTVEAELNTRGLSRDKVLAAVIQLLDTTLIRIGNDRYASENNTYGLTTLKNRHAHISSDKIEFKFIGKSKKAHQVTLQNRTLSKVVRQCQELPGQHLFSYVHSDGNIHIVSSSDVNAYLREFSQFPITAKDFRTWGGSVEALRLIRETRPENARQLSRVVSEVAKKLGNTATVCRQHYIHPRVISLEESSSWITEKAPRSRKYLDSTEVLFLERILKA